MRTRAIVLCLAALSACRSESKPGDGALGPELSSAPRRIVTLAPSLTEIVVALGASQTLVGVTRFDDAPEAKSLPRVGGYTDPSLETIVRLKPDVVLCHPASGNKGAVQAIANAGIPVRFFSLESIEDVRRTTLSLGSLLARPEEAAAEVARIDEARERARSSALRRQHRPKVALLVGIEPLIAAGPGSFSHELIADAGGENIVERSAQAWPQLSQERLLSQSLDALLFVGVEHGANPNALPASLRSKLLLLQSPGLLRPGPGIVAALEELSLHFDQLEPRP